MRGSNSARRRIAASMMLSFLSGFSFAAAQKPKAMNVLFISVDDLRPQTKYANIDFYHTDFMVTPNLDLLAGSGATFERAYTQVPTCGASRLSLLTGTRPFKEKGKNYGRFWNHLDRLDVASPSGAPAGFNHPLDANGRPAPTLPKILKENGFNTQSIGKIYHTMSDDEDSWTHGASSPQGLYMLETAKNTHEIGAGIHDTAYADGKIKNEAIGALRKLSASEKPFFLAVGFKKPHLPFNSPKKYWDLYDRQDIPLPENYFPPRDAPAASLHKIGEMTAYENIQYRDASRQRVTDDYTRTLIHGYYACVSYVDAMIGEVLGELDALGLREKTIIVLWSDHGWQLGEHEMWCKHSLYETALRIPLYLDVPGRPGQQRSPALVESADLFPTLCELTGIPRPGHLEGTSMVPLLGDPRRPWKGASFSNYMTGKSVRTERYRYSEYFEVDDTRKARMLYDQQADPQENVNIAERPGNQALVNTLSQLLADGWRRAAKGPANLPLSFDVLPDGRISQTVTARSGPLGDSPLRLLHAGRDVGSYQALRPGSDGALRFTVPDASRFQEMKLAFAALDGSRKKTWLRRDAGSMDYRWLPPGPGVYFYQISALSRDGTRSSGTGRVVVR